MKFKSCAIRLSLILCLLGITNVVSGADLHYHIRYQPEQHPDVMEVILKFDLKEYSNTFLMLPNEFGGNAALYKNIKIMKVKNATLRETEHGFAMELMDVDPEKPIEIQYQVKSSNKHDAMTLFDARAPIINRNYIHVIGNGFLVIPYHLKDKQLEVEYEIDFPKTWPVATSFGIEEEKKTVKTNFYEMLNFLLVGGHYDFKTFRVRQKQVVLAIQGKWRFTNEAMYQTLLSVISTVRAFWNDGEDRYFLVAVIPIRGTNRVQAGLGLTNAFTVHLSSQQAITSELKILLTHEYMHRWVTPKIVSQNTTDQEDHFWLTEGFTDYYAALLALRGGLINLTEYVQYFNRTLEEYMLSSAIDIPNSEIKETFWMNYDVGKIAYQRGFLLANHWNSQLKKKNQQSKHLDTWFKNIVIGWHQYQYWATHARMIANMRQLTNVIDIEGDIEQYIQQGKIIPVASTSLGPCVKLRKEQVYLTETGFDPKSSLATGRVTGVVKDDIAYQASLRNGQQVEQIYFDPLDYSKNIVVSLRNSSQKNRVVKYLGKKGKSKVIYRFYIDMSDDLFEPDTCLGWFGEVKIPFLDVEQGKASLTIQN